MTKQYIISISLLFILISPCTPAEKYQDSRQVEYAWDNYDNWYNKKIAAYKGWKYIVIHHSATQSGSVNAFHQHHTKQGYGGIAYHFVIGNGNGMKDGQVQKTFRWEQQISGTHVSVNSWEYNIFGIGICLVGNLENNAATRAQIKALQALVSDLKKTYQIKNENIIGHKHVLYDDASGRKEKTACPGKGMDMKKLKQ